MLKFKRGKIIKINFDINIGSELSNIHFAIVLNNDDNNDVDSIAVLPLTSKNYDSHILDLINIEIINFLTK